MLDEVINQEKVLECFDSKLMWTTLLNMTKTDFNVTKKFYNPEIVLRTLFNIVNPGTEIKLKEFIKQNALSFAFASTSLESFELRSLAYGVLSKFSSKLKDLTNEFFPERSQFIFLLKLFRHSVEENCQRISHVVSHFFARVSKLLMSPSDPCYAPITAFLSLKPTMSLNVVPEFMKLFFSSSTKYSNDERFWVLRLCSNALIEPQDYEIMNSVHVFESCQSYFLSTVATHSVKHEILFLFSNCVKLESVAIDFFQRLNFTTWIAQAMNHHFLNEVEELKLAEIFLKIISHLSNFYATEANFIVNNSRRRRRRAKAADDKTTLHLLSIIIKYNAQKVLDRLKKMDKSDENKINGLSEIVSKKWNLHSSF